MADTREITVTINGETETREVETRLNLADFLRHELELTGTHVGCEHGACGACTVLVDGEAVRSCLMLAVQADGHEVTSIEGLAAADGTLHPVQQAFWKNHGLQCGFCTSGMVISVVAFLEDNPDPSEAEVRTALSGNICRCTGYQGIVAATLEAAETLRGEN
ncbi:MAG: (2Fe-2S)-binding protein [Alphaproteobacteria bacterium]|jgi:carbon-monoxide dehydrogenase small subunit|nr:(2Fe-2S)-binding protein [Alphaproteobacteria bacterium]MCZ6510014.1 (2Fe-2S)-binding protein [Alphaproteobacteria bacterium]MCZ6586430.1 (2Fe-2S)-binding protein [Alphaproteobacteria bacterium]MCZ6591440.1 (2Fe-2S)-binding protein [Alphaproteobacteria bacterium]MCZ6840635.1 (2Fe-2S)-binding protein [Alphaproteobacteria bacterium]